jgi:hypothetical protein
MKKTWIHWVLAAIVIVLAGAVIAAAGEERVEVRVEQDGDDEITVDINGVTEIIRIDDLAEGESRTFGAGDHTIEVHRVGDALKLTTEAGGLGTLGGPGAVVWVTSDGEEVSVEGERVIKMRVTGDDEDGETRSYTLRMEDGDAFLDGAGVIGVDEIIMRNKGVHPHAIFVSEDGGVEHMKVFGENLVLDGRVIYRCEETGSTLTLAEEDAIEDAYICPATGCLMEKVEKPEKRVIVIEKRIEPRDE